MRRLLAGDGPGEKQLQVGPLLLRPGNIGLVRQCGKRVFGGETGNVKRGLHRLLDGGQGKVGGAGIATALTQVHRDAERFVAVALYVFQLTLAHRHAQAAALGGVRSGIGGAQFFGMGDGRVHQAFKKRAAVTEAIGRDIGSFGGRRRGSAA